MDTEDIIAQKRLKKNARYDRVNTIYKIKCCECGDSLAFSFKPAICTELQLCYTCMLMICDTANAMNLPNVPCANDLYIASYTEEGEYYVNGHYEKRQGWRSAIKHFCDLHWDKRTFFSK